MMIQAFPNFTGVTNGQLQDLVKRISNPSVSLFLPILGGGSKRCDPLVRLQRLVIRAKEMLREEGFWNTKQCLAPLQEWMSQARFPDAPNEGLAVFRSTVFFQCYRVPFRLEEKIVVGYRFCIRPLLPMLLAAQPQLRHQETEKALRTYDKLEHRGRTRTALDDVVRAAYDGEVQLLFLSADQEEWGSYDSRTRRITTHKVRERRDEDLVDAAASQTLLHRGTVVNVDRDAIPGRGLVAAALRR